MLHSSATIQIAPESAPSTPSWFTEVATFAQVVSPLRLCSRWRKQRWLTQSFGIPLFSTRSLSWLRPSPARGSAHPKLPCSWGPGA